MSCFVLVSCGAHLGGAFCICLLFVSFLSVVCRIFSGGARQRYSVDEVRKTPVDERRKETADRVAVLGDRLLYISEGYFFHQWAGVEGILLE